MTTTSAMPTAPYRWEAVYTRNGLIPGLKEEERMTPPQPPSQIGIQVTGADAHSQAGIAATRLQQALTALDSIRVWSEAYTAAELEALPDFPPGTGDEYKSALGEVPAVRDAFEATEFLKRLAGTGLWPASA